MPLLTIGIDQPMLSKLLVGLTASAEKVRAAAKSAVRTGAYFFKVAFVNAVKGNEFSWPALKVFPKIPKGTDSETKKQLRRISRTTSAKTSTKFLGKLARVFRYKMADDGLSAESGTLDESTSERGKRLFKIFQEGQTKTMSSGLRKYFGLLGYPLSPAHKPITQPARDLILPTWQKHKEELGKIMAAKMAEKLA